MKRKHTWILWACSLVSLGMLLPYLLETIDRNFGLESIPVSRAVFLLATFIQTAAYLAIACFAGAWFISKSGYTISMRVTKKTILLSVFLGTSAGLVVLALDYFFHHKQVLPNFFSTEPVTIWKGFLAAFYGGVSEEILLRFFLVSMIVFLLIKIRRRTNERIIRFAFLVAIILSAVLFGAGHLPAVAMNTALDSMIVHRVVLVNSIGGIVFGMIFWKWGLPAAMLSHFSADLVLLVFFPLMYT
jgi:membrane protease YdiL (CAAX protease family)